MASIFFMVLSSHIRETAGHFALPVPPPALRGAGHPTDSMA
jgi:hypothetical protein